MLGTNGLKTFWERNGSPPFLPGGGGHSGLSGNSLACPPGWSGHSELLSKAVRVPRVCRQQQQEPQNKENRGWVAFMEHSSVPRVHQNVLGTWKVDEDWLLSKESG